MALCGLSILKQSCDKMWLAAEELVGSRVRLRGHAAAIAEHQSPALGSQELGELHGQLSKIVAQAILIEPRVESGRTLHAHSPRLETWLTTAHLSSRCRSSGAVYFRSQKFSLLSHMYLVYSLADSAGKFRPRRLAAPFVLKELDQVRLEILRVMYAVNLNVALRTEP